MDLTSLTRKLFVNKPTKKQIKQFFGGYTLWQFGKWSTRKIQAFVNVLSVSIGTILQILQSGRARHMQAFGNLTPLQKRNA